jgi:hypothetical protein
MTSCLTKMIYNHCLKNKIISKEQKGCNKGFFGCKEQVITGSMASKKKLIFTEASYTINKHLIIYRRLNKILNIYKIRLTLTLFLKHF